MARLPGVSTKDTGPLTRLDLYITRYFHRRALAQLTGREPERMFEGHDATAHAPKVLQAHGKLAQTTAKMNLVDNRIKGLAELKAATLTQCEFCIDIGSQILRRWGLTDEELLALPSYKTSPLFTDVEKLVLDYAVAMTRTPAEVSDELFAELRKNFNSAQLVELTHLIAVGNLRGRFNVGLGIGAAGFSEGMVCAIPETVPQPPANAST